MFEKILCKWFGVTDEYDLRDLVARKLKLIKLFFLKKKMEAENRYKIKYNEDAKVFEIEYFCKSCGNEILYGFDETYLEALESAVEDTRSGRMVDIECDYCKWERDRCE